MKRNYSHKSLKIPKLESCLKWDTSGNRLHTLTGYVMTPYGIVWVKSLCFLAPDAESRTVYKLIYNGRLWIRYSDRWETTITAGKEARKFAQEVAAGLP